MSFKEGWYKIRTDHQRRTFYRYYISSEAYTCYCVVEPNGQQILLWYTLNPAEAKRDPLSASYVWAPAKRDGDWWDSPQNTSPPNADGPGDYARASRTPTARELCQRGGQADLASTDGLSCSQEIHVGIFFDGTNNNMERDRPDDGHSNVVSLYEAHRDDKQSHFAYYIPGVGTPFKEINEKGEDGSGKTFSKGGEARIHWAMLLAYNAVCRAVTGKDLIPEQEMTELVTTMWAGLATFWRLGDGKMVKMFRDIDQRLINATKGRRPTVLRVNLSVFGFSRGAAEARTYCNWMQKATQGRIGTAELQFTFLGLFDTVASVGLADSSPVGSGFLDWADGSLGLQGIRRSVHYVAAHEIRRSFPVSTARGDAGTAVAGTSEYVYPGAHSDIGGGYSPGDQGKSLSTRTKMLAQITLNDMHFEALNAGAALLPKDQMDKEGRLDFDVHPELDAAFSTYLRWTSADEKGEDVATKDKAVVTNRMESHMQGYWRWRGSKRTEAEFKAMSSYRNARAQDKVDLWEAELDWRNDVDRARKAHEPTTRVVASRAGTREVIEAPKPTATQRQLKKQVDLASSVPGGVDTFFDQFVHDSHAGFWVLGPQTRYDRNVFVVEIRRKKQAHDAAMRVLKDPYAGRAHEGASHRAELYRLNRFEEQVLQANLGKSNQDAAVIPVISDKDAADLRDNKGLVGGGVVKYVLGTGTRREADGHGQYRRVFDRT